MDLDIFKKTEGVLFNYRQLKSEIDNLQLEIDELSDMDYSGCNGITYAEKTSATYKTSDPTSSEIIHREKIIEKMKRELRGKQRLINKIDNAISSLSDLEIEIIKTYYTSNVKRTWLETGIILNMDSDYIRRKLRPNIINKLSSLIWIKHKYNN